MVPRDVNDTRPMTLSYQEPCPILSHRTVPASMYGAPRGGPNDKHRVMQATESAGVPPHPPQREDEELSTTSAVVVGGSLFGSHSFDT